MDWEASWVKWFDFTSSALGILSLVFSGMAWWKAQLIRDQQLREKRRREALISLILVDSENPSRIHELSYHPRRDQATRAEIQGILGAYYGEKPYVPAEIILSPLKDGRFHQMTSGMTNELRFTVPTSMFKAFVDNDPPVAANLNLT